MNNLVEASIKARKDAIFNAYDINNQAIIDKIEDLFIRINKLGESSTDNADFETKFANSTLNTEYINLFTEIANSFNQKNIQTEENTNIKTDGEYILDDAKSEVKYQLESAVQPLKGQVARDAYDKIRDIPVVGDAINIKQKIDFFSRFKKKKDR